MLGDRDCWAHHVMIDETDRRRRSTNRLGDLFYTMVREIGLAGPSRADAC